MKCRHSSSAYRVNLTNALLCAFISECPATKLGGWHRKGSENVLTRQMNGKCYPRLRVPRGCIRGWRKAFPGPVRQPRLRDCVWIGPEKTRRISSALFSAATERGTNDGGTSRCPSGLVNPCLKAARSMWSQKIPFMPLKLSGEDFRSPGCRLKMTVFQVCLNTIIYNATDFL